MLKGVTAAGVPKEVAAGAAPKVGAEGAGAAPKVEADGVAAVLPPNEKAGGVATEVVTVVAGVVVVVDKPRLTDGVTGAADATGLNWEGLAKKAHA